MLDQGNGSTAACWNSVGEIPHLCLIEDVAVLAFERSGDEGGRGLFLAVGTEADEGADRGPELDRLVGRQVARLDDLDLPVLPFRHEEQVDQPNCAVAFQPVQLGHDLAFEPSSIELEDEHLDRAERQRVGAGPVGGAHAGCRSFCFCCSNSSSVRTPCFFKSPSFWSCSMVSSEIPPEEG